VAYAPNDRYNLLSIGLLASKAKVQTYFNDEEMILRTKDNVSIKRAGLRNGLYPLHVIKLPRRDDTTFDPNAITIAAINFDDLVWKIYRRLGHLSFQNMLNLSKYSEGMGLTEKQIKTKFKTVCPIYATSRALVRIPRDLAKRHAQEPGELIYINT